MNHTQMHMDPFMHNAFWLEDRITVTFQLSSDTPTIPFVGRVPGGNGAGEDTAAQGERPRFISAPTFDKASAIRQLKLKELNDFLNNKENHYPTLHTIDFTDTLRTPGATPPDDPEQIGKYLFTSKDEQGNYFPTLICFFKFDSTRMTSSSTGPSFAMASMPGNSSANDDRDHDHDDHGKDSDDPVANLVNFINSQNNVDFRKQVSIISASPTWLTGAAPYVPVGCPLSPPIPVPEDAYCSSSPGLWPITLPELPTDLERMTGDGVNVIIVDTLPRQEDITRTIEGAEEHNLLLLDVANNVVLHHNHLPAVIDEPNPSQPKTGKDIKGRNGGGFRMADHGLFIAGIVRDIAPDAHVECIRALNDFCAGDSTAFAKTLEGIANRMLLVNPDDNNQPGDLYQKRVVINLSCVVPPDDILIAQGMDPDQVRKDLFHPIKSLVDLDAFLVASAGNEGDARYKPANPMDLRPKALYPAAFAYPSPENSTGLGKNMIPVGAVDKHGNPASYSCYPGDLGIATYGGDVPKQFKKDESGCYTEAEDIDALIGIYSALSYPALLLEDCRPTYPVPNAHAWAYWSGTSFSTPIVTGLVARILQYRLVNPTGTLAPHNVTIPQALTNAGATHQITWDRLDPGSASAPGPMLLAVQCTPTDQEDEDDQQVEVDVINVTVNEYNQ